jgi:hypothetical protein
VTSVREKPIREHLLERSSSNRVSNLIIWRAVRFSGLSAAV